MEKNKIVKYMFIPLVLLFFIQLGVLFAMPTVEECMNACYSWCSGQGSYCQGINGSCEWGNYGLRGWRIVCWNGEQGCCHYGGNPE